MNEEKYSEVKDELIATLTLFYTCFVNVFGYLKKKTFSIVSRLLDGNSWFYWIFKILNVALILITAPLLDYGQKKKIFFSLFAVLVAFSQCHSLVMFIKFVVIS